MWGHIAGNRGALCQKKDMRELEKSHITCELTCLASLSGHPQPRYLERSQQMITDYQVVYGHDIGLGSQSQRIAGR